MKYLKSFKLFEYSGYEGSAGAGVTPCCLITGRFRVGLRGDKVTMPDTWSTFGGGLHSGKTIEETVREELWEETQYKGTIELIKGYVYQDKHYTYHNYLGLVSQEYEPNLEDPDYPGEFENKDAKWVTLQELYDLEPKHPGFVKFIQESKYLFDKYGL